MTPTYQPTPPDGPRPLPEAAAGEQGDRITVVRAHNHWHLALLPHPPADEPATPTR